MDIEALLGRLDRRFMIDTLVDLARVPADVPMGHEVFIEPDDPKLVHYVQQVLQAQARRRPAPTT